MNNLYGIADVQIKIFNDDWNSVSRAVSDFCAKYNGNIIDLQFQNGFSGGCKQCIYESMYVAGFNFAYRCMCNFLFLYGTNTRDDIPEHWRPSWCPISQNVKGERYENNHRRSF